MEESLEKKKFFNTKNTIFILVVITAIAAGLIILMNVVLKNVGQETTAEGEVSSKGFYAEVSDTITNLVKQGNVGVKYYGSDQRTVLCVAGDTKCWSLRYDPSSKNIYVVEGSYTANATTNERKMIEAGEKANSTSGYEVLFKDVTIFSVDNADTKGEFPDGVVNITLGVDRGGLVRSTVKAEIPAQKNEE